MRTRTVAVFAGLAFVLSFSPARAEEAAAGAVADAKVAAVAPVSSEDAAKEASSLLKQAYTAAKHGVLGLTKTIAKEYGGRNIRCNAVSPGVVDTPLTSDVIYQPQYKDALLAPIPLGRFAEAEDVAKAVVWLCSDDAAYITGESMNVSGGEEPH